ncbi:MULTISPECIES: HlyD family type I secretion periplasmic adaptor subunit [unclassified Polaromonas]|uniref:HlyD family type I secretion periplasmic adaptor subunit n=1 Tax=unclassified Polaromonas TaxID=2638319 RepID=UPI001E2FB078|nr:MULTISPECIES: HlyD family type I secretion periplasmic adaptor subunit [unclassified Polaromonas]
MSRPEDNKPSALEGVPATVRAEAPSTAGPSTHQMEQTAAKVEDVTAKGEAPAAAPEAAAVPDKPVHPVIALLARYRAIFAAAWAHRDELAGPRRLSDEAAFLPAALSLQDTPVHPAPRRLAYTIMALFVIALVWSIFGKIDIVAVAPGRVVVSERTKLIQPLENSVVKAVLVKDGDHVVAGQPLVELDPTAASADKTTAHDQQKAALSEVLRTRAIQQALQNLQQHTQAGPGLQAKYMPEFPKEWSAAETAAAQAQLQGEWGDVTAKLAKLSSEISRRQAEIVTAQAVVSKLETTVPMAQARETDFKKLVDQGYISGHATQDKTRERVELERDLATQRANLLQTQATLRESENSRAAYLAEVRRTLYEREAQADLKRQQATQEQAKATQRENLTTLKAPVAGVVQQLAIHTTGGVVTEAQALMIIVPEAAQVTAEVTLENKDIGFVNAGQDVAVKLETFPFTRYGTVPATVKLVTADAVNDEKRGAIFPVTLTLNTKQIDIDGKMIQLVPGMNLTAEIKTGQRRVIEYLLSPIQRAGSESLRER